MKSKQNKKIRNSIIIFLVILTIQTFLLGALQQIVPEDTTLLGLPFPLIFFVWGIAAALLFIITKHILVGLRK